MGLDPPPLLLRNDIRKGVEDRPCRLQHQVSVLEQTLQGGGGGGDSKEAASLRTPEPLNPSIVDGPLVEGSVDCREYIFDLDGEGLNRPCQNQLETSSRIRPFLHQLAHCAFHANHVANVRSHDL